MPRSKKDAAKRKSASRKKTKTATVRKPQAPKRSSATSAGKSRAEGIRLFALAGRPSNGRPISVTNEFWPTEAVDGLRIVNTLKDNHALLMAWNSHLYVVYGVVYRWVDYSADMGPYCVLRRLLLLDTRFSDSRRTVEYNREIDDPAKVQGFLTISAAPQ